MSVLVLAVLLAVGGAGCGSGDDREQARAAVQQFYDAIRADDGGAACDQLADDTVEQLESQSGQSCDQVVTRLEYEGGEIARVEVYAMSADVELSSMEHAFLSEGSDGWKLAAIACTSKEGEAQSRPLDCEVEA
jgi:hypothetical protein